MHRIPWNLTLPILLMLALPCLSTRAAGLPAPLAVFNLATLPEAQLDKDAWSAPAREGDIAFRSALAGKSAAVRLHAWWKDGDLRPPEGDRYILEVKYKDVLTNPAQVLAFGGVGWGFGNSPMQQLGGANDGQWKTANIPIPWDMICRIVSSIDPRRNLPEMTSVSFVVAANLPIATLSVRRAVPEDETRFYAECRAFIAGEQAAARAKTPLPEGKATGALQGPLAAYPWEAACYLYPNNTVKADAVGRPVNIRMCLNEFESGSFGVYANGTPLTGVDYEITPLLDASGNALAAGVERRTAEYALRDGAWSPLRLWPAYAADIPAGRSHWFYFTLQTRRGESHAGTYKGRILIHTKDGKTELPLEVVVLPVDLLTMEEAGITMYGCYEKTPPLHDIEFQRRYNYGGALLWYSKFAPPVALKDGKLAFDFTYPDDWMKGARQRGFTGAIWYLGGDPNNLPNSANLLLQLGTLDRKMTRADWCASQKGQDHILPTTRNLFVEWMRAVNHHAVDNTWLELLPTPQDEPQKWTKAGQAWVKPFFKDGCAAIREADPRIRIYGCIHHVNNHPEIPGFWRVFADDIDIYDTNAIHEDNDVGNKVRALGKASLAQGGRDKWFWQYTGVGNGAPESQRFTFGFYFGAFGSSGCTAWAYNWGDTWDLSGHRGDQAVTAWPTVYQTIPTPGMEGQREGLDDRRLIATYQKRFAGDAAAMKVLDGIFEEVKASRARYSPANTETGFFDVIDDTAKLIKWRNLLLDRLAVAGR